MRTSSLQRRVRQRDCWSSNQHAISLRRETPTENSSFQTIGGNLRRSARQPGNGGSECGRAALSSAFREPPWTVLISLFAGNLLAETVWHLTASLSQAVRSPPPKMSRPLMNRARLAQCKVHSTWRALLQDIELVPQYPYFGFQPPPRAEAVVQQSDEKQANCNHQPQSCSDSVAAATPADGVFGSDTSKQADAVRPSVAPARSGLARSSGAT
jgi:hypothetical protein